MSREVELPRSRAHTRGGRIGLVDDAGVDGTTGAEGLGDRYRQVEQRFSVNTAPSTPLGQAENLQPQSPAASRTWRGVWGWGDPAEGAQAGDWAQGPGTG